MARRKIFGKKTFSKKHKSRRGRKITSNKTRRFRGGFGAMSLANLAKLTPQGRAASALANSSQVQKLIATATNVASASPRGQSTNK